MSWKKIDSNAVVEKISNLQGKKWVVLGDSNSQGSYSIPYHQIIKNKVGVNVTSFASGGTGWIAKSSTGIPPRIIEQLALAPDDLDIITILAGGNDYSFGYPLGELGDTSFDTFYGALDATITEAINKYPLKKFAVLTQFRRRVETVKENGLSVELQVKATIEVCRKYSVPVLDLYHEANLYPWNDEWFAACMADGAHLSQKGQDIIAEKILTFLETL